MSETHSPIEQPVIVNDPIRSVRALRRFEFVRTHLDISADTALVLIGADGIASTYASNHQPTRGELVVRNYVKLYEVDVAHHHQFFECRLPSRGDASFFLTEVDVRWYVEDPETVARRGVRDVRAAIEPLLRRVMTSRTRRFAIEDNAAAEAEVNRALDETRIGDGFGLQVECTARLSLDLDALEHYAVLRKHSYQTLEDAELHAGAQAATRHEQELIQQRIDFYKRHFLEDHDMWALMLARNPDDVPLVLEGLRSDERQAMATKLQLIEKLIKSGRLEDHMLEEPTKLALETMREVLSNVAAGTTTVRPLYKQQLPQLSQDHED